jgi:hypothetical protein
MDWATIALTNLFVLLSVHVAVKVMVRYRVVALAFQVAQLAMYTLS